MSKRIIVPDGTLGVLSSAEGLSYHQPGEAVRFAS